MCANGLKAFTRILMECKISSLPLRLPLKSEANVLISVSAFKLDRAEKYGDSG